MAAGILTAAMQAACGQTDGAHANDAQMGDLAWRILRDTGNADQLRRFIAEAPNGPQRRAAEERLKTLEPRPPRQPAATPSWPAAPPVRDASNPAPLPPSDLNVPQTVFQRAEPVQDKSPGGLDASSLPSDESPSPLPLPPLDRAAPQPSQKVVLYEEDLSNPNGVQFLGTAIWRIEPAPSVDGTKSDGVKSGIAIRADLVIPERGMAVRLTLQRNDDKMLSASHTVDIVFRLSPDFPHAGVQNIPGLMMKQSETNRGIALNGVAVKVTDNVFIVGLAAMETEMKRNVALLKERTWFDIPVVYGDGKRALIAIDKGEAGARAFAEAFAAWEREEGQ
jgi:hypothetical protein